MIPSKGHDNNDNFVNIYAINDRRMKELGQVLKTPKSRKIYQILMDKELHTKEIGMIIENESNPRLPNLTHHLKKMTKIGLLTSTVKMKNGHALTYYKAVKYLVIVPSDDIDVALKSKTLKSTLRKVFKISSVSAIGVLSYLFLQLSNTSEIYILKNLDLKYLFDHVIPMATATIIMGIENFANFFKTGGSTNIECLFNYCLKYILRMFNVITNKTLTRNYFVLTNFLYFS